jgi:mono/diheme cytochrome c family protein
MATRSQAVLVIPVLALPLLLAACPGEFAGGYDKVPFRERTPVALAAAPDPPPVVAGVGIGAPAEIPQLRPEIAPPGVTQAMVEEGQQLYGTVCTACHGVSGVGTPVGPSLNDQNWIQIEGRFDEIVAIIQSGVTNPVQYPGAMPPLGGGNFSPDQVRSIAAYLFALSHQTGP